MDLNGKIILVTGGTGSFGKRFTETVLKRYPKIQQLVIFSRDGTKQQQMATSLPDSRISYITGDIADKADVDRACRGVDIIIHTAAMRIVPEAEANPTDCISTNITGAQNLIASARKYHIRQILALSTDMASLVNNVYGASKMLSDKLFIAAHKDYPELKTCIIRYGNMFGSASTVIPFFQKKAAEEGVLPVTHPEMTRFMSTISECIEIALKAMERCLGGEIIAPKIKSYNILTIAKAVDAKACIKIIGLRPGEKLYEEMVTRYDSFHTIEASDCYVIVPPYADTNTYCSHYSALPVSIGFEFNSANNPHQYTVDEIQTMIRS